MNQAEFGRVAETFSSFHQRFAPLFGRKEVQGNSEQYLRGLLVQQTDRRNAENIAESIEGATPRTLQRLLTESPWPTEPVGLLDQQPTQVLFAITLYLATLVLQRQISGYSIPVVV